MFQKPDWLCWVSKIANPQEFMNQASLTFYNICNTNIGFQGSSQIITKCIVAMLAEKNRKQKPATDLSTSNDYDPDTKQ